MAGGWIYPTTYSVGTTFVPIFSTRSGPGNPLFYLSLRSGRLRNMLYDSSGTLIHDVIEPEPMGVVLKIMVRILLERSLIWRKDRTEPCL